MLRSSSVGEPRHNPKRLWPKRATPIIVRRTRQKGLLRTGTYWRTPNIRWCVDRTAHSINSEVMYRAQLPPRPWSTFQGQLLSTVNLRGPCETRSNSIQIWFIHDTTQLMLAPSVRTAFTWNVHFITCSANLCCQLYPRVPYTNYFWENS